ncbi:TrkA family potassium uptake protein [Persephonella atlantica]|uniref:TrkA family potassium uptake protein n=1 Tax=Persephonella atlantica TaxID=2699429 RepID=A0ABS1GIM5_9AQUI|nr:NAD-binding protein [Persephonella atlantica]MBK3332726.1 TrkA family potassium uptake protein [Persephonella atlantica]
MVSEKEKRKLTIFGLGFFGLKILRHLSDRWDIIGIDLDEELINELKEEFKNKENIKLISGDASSILTWKKLRSENIKYIISTIRDTDVSLEICRIARDVFNLDASIMVLLFEQEREKEFEKFNISIIKPAEIITNAVVSKIEKNYTIATNIGLGKGEIIEVHILARSHLVDRKLKYLKPTKWRIAAIYRDGELIIPTGDDRIKVGDRVVIIGDPKVLENLVNILLKGIPQFPLQFGSDFAVIYHPKWKKSFEEASYFKKGTKAHKLLIYPFKNYDMRKDFDFIKKTADNFEIKSSINSYLDLFSMEDSIGVVIIPFLKEGLFSIFKLKKIFETASKPFLLSRGRFPYRGIVVSLNCPDPAFTLEMGIEISRLMKLPFEAVFSVMPAELRGVEEEEAMKERNNIISDFEHIYKKEIKYAVLEGNPVKKTAEYLRDRNDYLLVLSYDKKEDISILNPSVPFYIARNSRISTLCFPLEETYE